jgi:hypothetical protein
MQRENMREFSQADQSALIGAGLTLLQFVGARPINAFRAGNYGLNTSTLAAFAKIGIYFDTSYNAAADISVDGVAPG